MTNRRKISAQSTEVLKIKVALSVAVSTVAASQSYLFTVLPPLGRDLGISDLQVASIAALSSVCFVFAAPLLGAKSETWGRKPLILAGLVAAVVSNSAFGVVLWASFDQAISVNETYIAFAIVRATAGICWAGMFPASQALIADLTPPEGRAAGLAVVGMAFGIGTISGPSVAWATSIFGAQAPFYSMAFLSLLSLVVACVALAPASISAQREVRLSDKNSHISLGAFRFVVIGLLLVVCSSSVQQLTAFRLQDEFMLDTAATTRMAGVALTGLAAALFCAQALTMRLKPGRAPKAQSLDLLMFGSLTGFVALFLLGLNPTASYFAQVAMLSVFGFGAGFLFSGSAIALTLTVAGGQQGRAAGLLASAHGIGFAIGSFAGGAIYQANGVAPFLIDAVLMLIIFGLAMSAKRQLVTASESL